MAKTSSVIKFKLQCPKRYWLKHYYDILSNNEKIGEIIFIKKKKIFVIGYLGIFEPCRKKHYGYKVINHILSQYKIDCIIGETLYKSRGFWNKCIKKFNGERKNIALCDNCTSSFIIPKYKIDEDLLIELLKLGYEIT